MLFVPDNLYIIFTLLNISIIQVIQDKHLA